MSHFVVLAFATNGITELLLRSLEQVLPVRGRAFCFCFCCVRVDQRHKSSRRK
jgi:hypothetical protein